MTEVIWVRTRPRVRASVNCPFARKKLFAKHARGGACVPNNQSSARWRVRGQQEKVAAKVFKNRLVIPKTEAVGGWHQRGYFPHFDGDSVTQHVSFHLADSLPQSVLDRWREELKHLGKTGADIEFRTRIQNFLDAGHGNCWLRDDRLAEIVQNSLLHFDAEQYRLHAWCVMPNHVHALFTPAPGYEMSRIVGDWKSVTSHRCCNLLGHSGRFWHKEYFDRYIRNEQHYRNALAYIEDNPVKAGLCGKPEDWPWSSAGMRAPFRAGRGE